MMPGCRPERDDLPAERGLPPIPVGSRARRIAFADDTISQICATLQTEPRAAAFSFEGNPVMQAEVAGSDGREAVTLTFWPSLRRVDASSPQATVVMTEIGAVDLVEGVEVQFRRSLGGYLIVALGGKIIVRV